MRKFKKGQTVYFYRTMEDYAGEIISGTISGATKDLLTNEIKYEVAVPTDVFYLCWNEKEVLKAENLYTSRKKIYKEHRDEIAYLALYKKIAELENSVNTVFTDYADKIKANPDFGCATIRMSNTGSPSIIIDGIGDLRAEFNKLKDEVVALKKKIKKPTKKPVVKKEEKKEVVGI